MLSKSRQVSKFFTACTLSRPEALLAYKQLFIPSVPYGAVSLSLTPSDIETLHSIYIPGILPRMDYKIYFPRVVNFTLIQIEGIELVPLNTIITQQKITFMMRQLKAGNELGKVLLINLRCAQLQSGRRAPVFTIKSNIEYIENIWVIQLQNALHDMGGKFLIHKYMAAS